MRKEGLGRMVLSRTRRRTKPGVGCAEDSPAQLSSKLPGCLTAGGGGVGEQGLYLPVVTHWVPKLVNP